LDPGLLGWAVRGYRGDEQPERVPLAPPATESEPDHRTVGQLVAAQTRAPVREELIALDGLHFDRLVPSAAVDAELDLIPRLDLVQLTHQPLRHEAGHVGLAGVGGGELEAHPVDGGDPIPLLQTGLVGGPAGG